MTAIAGFETQVARAPKIGLLAPKSELCPPFSTLAGTSLQPCAMSFRANWQSQLYGIATIPDSNGSQIIEVANAWSSKQEEASPDQMPQNGTALPPELLVPGTEPSKQTPAQSATPNLINGADLRTLSTRDEGKSWPKLTHARRASIGSSHAGNTPGWQTPDANRPMDFGHWDSIVGLQWIFQPVQVPLSNLSSISPEEKNIPGSTSHAFAPAVSSSTDSGEPKRPLFSLPSSAQSLSDGHLAQKGSSLDSIQDLWPGTESLPGPQATRPASSETGPPPQADLVPLQSIHRSFGFTTSASASTNTAEDSSTLSRIEQGSKPSVMPSHQDLLQTHLVAPAENAITVARSRHEEAEAGAGTYQSTNRNVNEDINSSELAANKTPLHKPIPHASSKRIDSIADSAKPSVQSSLATNADVSVSAASNGTHPPSDRANRLSFADLGFVDTASTQNPPGYLAHPTDIHRSAGDAFNALDSGTAMPEAKWGPSNAHRAEAGFQDSSLGWVGIRAEVNGAGVHATVSGSSHEAMQVLGGHLDGLAQYLADHRTPVETLTLASPGGHGHSGFGARGQEGNREGCQQEQSDSSRSVPGPLSLAQDVRHVPDPVTAGINTRLRDGGTYISVMA